MIKHFALIAFVQLLLSFNALAGTHIWSYAVPKEVHVVPNGLMLIGDFNNNGVECAGDIVTGSIFLPNTDLNFDHKLSLALTAHATKKQIQVLLATGADSECVSISASGYVPTAFYYYWQLKS